MEKVKLDSLTNERLTEDHGKEGFTLVAYGSKKYRLLDTDQAMEGMKTFKLREDDIWIGGFMRSGTHWLAEQIWLLCNNVDFEKALAVPQGDRIFYFDYNIGFITNETVYTENGHELCFGGLPSPRLFKTHMPLSGLPADLLDKSKMVYVIRDPRDVVVSCYHYYKSHNYLQFNKDLKEFWELFRTDNCLYCPYFENIKEYWSQKDHRNLLILFYEDMLKDLNGTMRRVAKFLGKNYTHQQFDVLYKHLQFSNMKMNKSVNYNEKLGDQATEVVRKGVAGGWRSEFDEKMTREAEEWMAKNLSDVDFKFN